MTNILSDRRPLAGIDTILYTVGANVSASGSIFCTNQGLIVDKINVALVRYGNTLDDTSYIVYQSTIYQGQGVYLQEVCLGPQDSIYINSSDGLTSFIFTGKTY